METNKYFYLGFATSLVIGLLIVFIAMIIRRKNKENWCKYDERQIMAQGKAYKYSFLFCIIYYSAFGCFQGVTDAQWISNFEGIYLGILLSVFLFAAYAIWKDAYISLQENPRKYVCIFSALMIINLLPCISKLLHGEALETNRLNLILGLALLFILLLMAVKHYRDKNQEDAE